MTNLGPGSAEGSSHDSTIPDDAFAGARGLSPERIARRTMSADKQPGTADEPPPREVTLVSAVLLRPGTEEQHAPLHNEGVQAAHRVGGLVRAQLIPAVPRVQEDTVAVLTFRDRADLDRWLASPERLEILHRMRHLTQGDRRTNVLSEFPAWFSPGTSTPRWKQAVAVIAGLIPVSLAMTYILALTAPDLHWVAATVVTAVFNVCALTWLVMPGLNRLLQPWLAPRGEASSSTAS